jgi:hypothetical protein
MMTVLSSGRWHQSQSDDPSAAFKVLCVDVTALRHSSSYKETHKLLCVQAGLYKFIFRN